MLPTNLPVVDLSGDKESTGGNGKYWRNSSLRLRVAASMCLPEDSATEREREILLIDRHPRLYISSAVLLPAATGLRSGFSLMSLSVPILPPNLLPSLVQILVGVHNLFDQIPGDSDLLFRRHNSDMVPEFFLHSQPIIDGMSVLIKGVVIHNYAVMNAVCFKPMLRSFEAA